MIKKFTLLFMLLAVSFGYAQTLTLGDTFDFENTLHGFVVGAVADGNSVTNGTGNDVLEVTSNGNTWDSAKVTFATPIDLQDAANNTITFTAQSTTAAVDEVRFHGLSFQGGGGSIELNFETTGTDVANIVLNFGAVTGTRNEMFFFMDTGVFGVGGDNFNTGTYIIDNVAFVADPETCDDGILNQDETDVDCGGTFCAPCDVTAPTAFTATAGTVGISSVELLLNATDDSAGTITYDITYDGAGTAQTTEASGVQKSLVISGLTPETMYTFMVSASDASGNPAANNAITVMATTIADSSTSCAGFSSEASEGSYSVGYNYNFSTTGTDVLISFELLDTDKSGFVPQVFIAPSTFLNMDSSAAPTYTYTLTGQVTGTMPNFAIRGAYAGGLVTSKFFDYTVGDDCGTLGIDDLAKTSFSLFPNPTQNNWTVKTQNIKMSSIKVFDVLGKNVLILSPNTSEAIIDGSSLKAGLYFAQIKTATGINSIKLVKN